VDCFGNGLEDISLDVVAVAGGLGVRAFFIWCIIEIRLSVAIWE
jgi:hypothetical protein